MRFPRNVKIFRGQLDAAPFAGVIFLVLIFLLLHTKLAYTPGVRIELPEVKYRLSGTPNRTVIVAVDVTGQLYYENQPITEEALLARLKQALAHSPDPLTLELQADRSAKPESALRVLSLASGLNFDEVLWVLKPLRLETEKSQN